MELKNIIPKPEMILRESLIVLGGVIIAAYVISKFPAIKALVQDNSITVKDQNGNVLY